MLLSEPICENCKHLNKEINACEAFPKGIPDDILDGLNDHSKPLPEQRNNIVFEPKTNES
jgi:hypothetical protein